MGHQVMNQPFVVFLLLLFFACSGNNSQIQQKKEPQAVAKVRDEQPRTDQQPIAEEPKKELPKRYIMVEKVPAEPLQPISYVAGGSELNETSFPLLEEVSTVLKNRPTMKIRIEVHTSRGGKESNNVKLSKKRAEEVYAYLIRSGVSGNQLTFQGYGSSKLLPGSKPTSLANNRTLFIILSQ